MFLGGRGIDMYLLYNLVEKGINPFHPDNVFLVGVGLLVGIPGLGAARTDVAAKSPLTGGLGDSNIGGFFGVTLRMAGFDHLVIKGKAEKPVYLWIHDGIVEMKDASHLWGTDTFEAQEALKEENGKDVQCLVIGQAGENLVRFACVRSGLKSSAGRTGMGAVMGSKNLKALVVRGDNPIEWFQAEKLYKYTRTLNEKMLNTKWGKALSKFGSIIMFEQTYPSGGLRFKNFQSNFLEGFEGLGPKSMEKYSKGFTGCYGCLLKCRRKYVLGEGPYSHVGEGPEYNLLLILGTNLGCSRLETILVCNHLCNKYGLDVTDVGNLIGWLMELYEKKIIDEKFLGGLKPSWGNEEAIFRLIEMMAFREGIGDILAEGIKYAAQKIGGNSEYYALHVKGLGYLGSDDRATPSFALGMAVATRGADHLRSRPAIDLYGLPEEVLERIYGGKVSSDSTSYEGKSRMIHWHELEYAVVDSLGLCKWQTIFISVNAPSFDEWTKLIAYATGLELNRQDLMEIGERIYTIERMFNVREGFTRKDDYPPKRMFKEKTNSGPAKVKEKSLDSKKFNQLLDEYYALHGWDMEGIPKPETLTRLRLAWEKSFSWPKE